MTQNKLLWIAVGVLVAIQIVVLYQVIQKPSLIVGQNTPLVPAIVSEGSEDNTSTDIINTPQAPMENITAGSGVREIQGYVNNYTNGVLSFTTLGGQKAKAIISADTKVFVVGKAKSQTQLDAEINAYVKQLEALQTGGEQNIAKIEIFESPLPYTEVVIQPSELKKGDSILVVYISTKSDGSYNAIRVGLPPKKSD